MNKEGRKWFVNYFIVILPISLGLSIVGWYGELILLLFVILPSFIGNFKESVKLRITNIDQESVEKKRYATKVFFGVFGVILNVAIRIILSSNS